MIYFWAYSRLLLHGSSEDENNNEVYELGFLEQFNTHATGSLKLLWILFRGLSHICSL